MAGELILKKGLISSGSIIATSGITGSFSGSLSGSVTNATSASYALSSSFASTSSYISPLTQSVFISGSLTSNGNITITGSATNSLLVKGSGATSSTTSLLVQNSAGTTILQQTDDGGLRLPVQSGQNINNLFIDGTAFNNATANIAIVNGGYQGQLYLRSIGSSATGYPSATLGKAVIQAPTGLIITSNYAGALNNTDIAMYIYQSKGVHINGFTEIASSQLTIDSTSKGFLQPRMTEVQRNAISSPTSGLQVYNSSVNKNSLYNGTIWANLLTDSGSQSITGSLTVTAGITGSFSGSGIITSASYALSASYVPSTPTFPYTGSAIISGSLRVTGSISATGTIHSDGDVEAGNNLKSMFQAGDEGGELFLNVPATNTNLLTGVTVDIYQDRFRIFETGGSNRGYYLEMTSGSAGVDTNLKPDGYTGTVTIVGNPPGSQNLNFTDGILTSVT